MSRDDRRWCLVVSVGMILLTSIPYLVAFSAQGKDWVFTGFIFGVEDGNSYIAKMLQGAQGAWLFRTPYASRVEASILAFLPYLLLGKLAAGPETHLQLVMLFHVARLALIPLAVVTVYRFVSFFVSGRALRRWATLLIIAGGGLGWLLILSGQTHLLGNLPLDLYSPETFGFLAYLGLPHLLLAKTLLLLFLIAYLRAAEGRRRWVSGGLLLLLLGLVQPLTVISAYAAMGAHLLVLVVRRAVGRGSVALRPWLSASAVAVAVSVPIPAYYALGTRLNPALEAWTAQNILPSPHPVHYLIAYGLVLIPAAIGIRAAARKGEDAGFLLPAWALALFVLAYAPVPYQRRLIEGAWVALVVLAAAGLESARLEEKIRRPLAAGLMGASLLTTTIVLVGGTWSALHPGFPLFLPAGEVRAMEWLGENAAPDSVVLAAFETGNALPAWAPVRSVMGHGPETPNLAELRPVAEAVFGAGETNTARVDFLRAQRVDFAFVGPAERALGGWDPSTTPGMTEVYRDGEYAIFAFGGD